MGDAFTEQDDETGQDWEVDTDNKIYCANCEHCILVKSSAGRGGQYYLRVRCDAGKWRKKLGEEKIYKYFTVARRSLDSCSDYIPMGDPKEFIRDLKKNLPIKDEVYSG
ncbi:MAG: hypothetical protein LBQ61_00290 [Spirochaetales bacterium]|jgi:hypothetical protein|nr:hypothetical protein [Spirochaetales bacterium]